MKAVLCRRYGSAELAEIAKPVPGEGEVLIRVRASSANPLDWHFMEGTPYPFRILLGLRRPRGGRAHLGVDVAGEVEAAGRKVTELKAGDAVFGACDGAYAEYVCAPESAVVRKPDNLTFEQAAAVNIAGVTALQALRDFGRLQAGHRVLINGAAGGVGTFAVQLARAFGAEVTGVCSTGNVELVRSLGAARVIDYTRDDFTAGGQRYDVILDCIGNRSLAALKGVLQPAGRYVAVGGPDGRWIGPLAHMLKTFAASATDRNVVVAMARRSKADLTTLRDLLQSGTVTPVIDRLYPLDETVQALKYVEQGHARGKVVITVR